MPSPASGGCQCPLGCGHANLQGENLQISPCSTFTSPVCRGPPRESKTVTPSQNLNLITLSKPLPLFGAIEGITLSFQGLGHGDLLEGCYLAFHTCFVCLYSLLQESPLETGIVFSVYVTGITSVGIGTLSVLFTMSLLTEHPHIVGAQQILVEKILVENIDYNTIECIMKIQCGSTMKCRKQHLFRVPQICRVCLRKSTQVNLNICEMHVNKWKDTQGV